MTSTGYSQDNLNKLINSINNRITCDDECQKNMHAQMLKQKWQSAVETKKNASKNVNLAEEKYYSYLHGQDDYEALMEHRRKISISKIKGKLLDKHQNDIQQLNQLAYTLETQMMQIDRIKELVKLKKQENKFLKEKTTSIKDTAFTNNRRVEYENKSIDTLKQIRKVILLLYYLPFISLVVRIFTGSVQNNEQYPWSYQKILNTIAYIILPIFVDKIVNMLTNSYKRIL